VFRVSNSASRLRQIAAIFRSIRHIGQSLPEATRFLAAPFQTTQMVCVENNHSDSSSGF
jgi:hypothetical protein